MKKILILNFCLIFVINLNVISQEVVEPIVLDKTKWIELFKSKYHISVKECIKVEYLKDSLFLPEEWCYNDGLCGNCKYLYYPISTSAFFLVMPNDAPIGTYLFYFDLKNRKSWCQVNFSADSISLIRYRPDLWCFNLNSYDELNEQENNRLIYVNPLKGILLNKTIDIKGKWVSLISIDESMNKMSFGVKDNVFFDVNYLKMNCSKKHTDIITYTTPFYSRILKINKMSL